VDPLKSREWHVKAKDILKAWSTAELDLVLKDVDELLAHANWVGPLETSVVGQTRAVGRYIESEGDQEAQDAIMATLDAEVERKVREELQLTPDKRPQLGLREYWLVVKERLEASRMEEAAARGRSPVKRKKGELKAQWKREGTTPKARPRELVCCADHSQS
jgi:hypothetical protein